jgi:hypothetical protein
VTQTHTEATLARLQAVDWKGDTGFDHRRSRVRLMAEYLRRAAIWAQALDATDEWPFFDIAAYVDPSVHAPADQAKALEVLINRGIGWDSVQTAARAALRWAVLLDANVTLPPGLEDPFEPLLLMFDRGGAWTTEAGFIDVDGAALRQQTWLDHLEAEPRVTLDQAALDVLDTLAGLF